MDILSHGLWAGAAAKALQHEVKRPLHFLWAVFFGMFPDMFAFAIPFVWTMVSFLSGVIGIGDIPQPDAVEPAMDPFATPRSIRNNFTTMRPTGEALPVFQIASVLYQYSHSIVIFFWLFFAIIIYRYIRRPIPGTTRFRIHEHWWLVPWEMLGWLLHILTDIPTHSYRFYPTPFLWPFSSFKFSGFSWGTPWFLIANFTALIVVYVLLFLRHARKRRR